MKPGLSVNDLIEKNRNGFVDLFYTLTTVEYQGNERITSGPLASPVRNNYPQKK
jgi:hypothetical protein